MKKQSAIDTYLLADRACLRKVRYHTEIDADLDCARLWLLENRDVMKYRCDWCSKWHLTHMYGWRDTYKHKDK